MVRAGRHAGKDAILPRVPTAPYSAPAAGTWAVVTGGSRGIGRATALELARRGLHVAIVHRERHDAAAQVAQAVEGLGVRSRTIAADVSDEDAVRAAAAGLDDVSTLVNAAGITRDRTLLKLARSDWDAVLATNLTGALHWIQALLPQMRERGYGRIVNVASIIGQTGNVGQANYAASKAGLVGLTKSLAQETARRDITVNAVCPGFIETDMLADVPEDARAHLLAQIPKGRFGAPDEVADAIAFLADPATSYVTGAELNVNGGMHM